MTKKLTIIFFSGVALFLAGTVLAQGLEAGQDFETPINEQEEQLELMEQCMEDPMECFQEIIEEKQKMPRIF